MWKQRIERVVPDVAGTVEHGDLFAAELPQDLTARPARKAGRRIRAHDDGEPYPALIRIGVGNHPSYGITLGAHAEPVGGILDVAANMQGASTGQDCGPDPEAAVRRVGP